MEHRSIRWACTRTTIGRPPSCLAFSARRGNVASLLTLKVERHFFFLVDCELPGQCLHDLACRIRGACGFTADGEQRRPTSWTWELEMRDAPTAGPSPSESNRSRKGVLRAQFAATDNPGKPDETEPWLLFWENKAAQVRPDGHGRVARQMHFPMDGTKAAFLGNLNLAGAQDTSTPGFLAHDGSDCGQCERANRAPLPKHRCPVVTKRTPTPAFTQDLILCGRRYLGSRHW
jgi:hypothetical protein